MPMLMSDSRNMAISCCHVAHLCLSASRLILPRSRGVVKGDRAGRLGELIVPFRWEILTSRATVDIEHTKWAATAQYEEVLAIPTILARSSSV
jgi:hypothetical protein